MRRILVTLALALLSACATVTKPHFYIDQFVLVVVQYHSPTQIAGVNLSGAAPKEEICQRAAAAYLSQASSFVPKTDRVEATCLEVKFIGPIDGGQTVLQPFRGTAVTWVIVPIEYDSNGKLLGVGEGDGQAIPGGADTATCKARADDIRTSTYGHVPQGGTLLAYCVGILRGAAELWHQDGPTVYTQPCPDFPFAGAGPCEMKTVLVGGYVVQMQGRWMADSAAHREGTR